MFLWISRLLIGLVIAWNLQAAFSLLFLAEPNRISFSLYGPGALIATQGMGLLFIMWNVPYLFALMNPIKYRTSLIESILMQLIALGGEVVILGIHSGLPEIAIQAIQRFIIFDLTGVIFLLASYRITRGDIFIR